MTIHNLTTLVLTGILGGMLSGSVAAQNLSDLHRITNGVSGSHVEYHRVEIGPGKETPLADLPGPGKVTYFNITDDTQGRFFPGVVLKILWDGETEPSIQVPLSDFFGAIGGQT